MKTNQGMTVLNHAIEADQPAVVWYLLDMFPADLNDPQLHKPKPPLHIACTKGRYTQLYTYIIG